MTKKRSDLERENAELRRKLERLESEATPGPWSGSPEELSGYIEGSIEAAQEIARASERRRVCDAIERRLRDARNAIVPSMRRKMGPQVEADAHRHGLRQAIEIVRGMREGSDK